MRVYGKCVAIDCVECTEPSRKVCVTRTLPMAISSTRSGVNPMRSLVSLRMAYIRYSTEVSLKPPFLPLQSGVRMARVMTTSSGFLEVLQYVASG